MALSDVINEWLKPAQLLLLLRKFTTNRVINVFSCSEKIQNIRIISSGNLEKIQIIKIRIYKYPAKLLSIVGIEIIISK